MRIVKNVMPVMLGASFLAVTPVMAEEVSCASVLTGTVVSVAAVGTQVKEGDVLLTVASLAGPMPAIRAQGDGVVKVVKTAPGAEVQQGAAVIIVDEK